MCSVMITTAACLWEGKLGEDNTSLNNIQDMTSALESSRLAEVFGRLPLKLLLAAGILGASLVASIVVSLTAAWGLGEVAGYARTLETTPSEAPWFYAVYAGLLVVGAGFTLSPIPTVGLNVAIQMMNAALLPIVLGFLFLLVRHTGGKQHRLSGCYAWLVGMLFLICSVFGLLGAWLALPFVN